MNFNCLPTGIGRAGVGRCVLDRHAARALNEWTASGGRICHSATNLSALKLPPLPKAAEVIIAADNDGSGVGAAAAFQAAQHWKAEGRRVRIATLDRVGDDMNDVLRERDSQ